jgi:hypothetical protein
MGSLSDIQTRLSWFDISSLGMSKLLLQKLLALLLNWSTDILLYLLEISISFSLLSSMVLESGIIESPRVSV